MGLSNWCGGVQQPNMAEQLQSGLFVQQGPASLCGAGPPGKMASRLLAVIQGREGADGKHRPSATGVVVQAFTVAAADTERVSRMVPPVAECCCGIDEEVKAQGRQFVCLDGCRVTAGRRLQTQFVGPSAVCAKSAHRLDHEPGARLLMLTGGTWKLVLVKS